jgi:hypothetical protein
MAESKKQNSSFGRALFKGGMALLGLGAAAFAGYALAQDGNEEENKIRAEIEKRRRKN